MGIDNLFYIDLFSSLDKKKRKNRQFAATERCPWRKTVLEGAVHDDNAFAMGGVAGHAGLFGTAKDIFVFLSELLSAYYDRSQHHLFRKEIRLICHKRGEFQFSIASEEWQ